MDEHMDEIEILLMDEMDDEELLVYHEMMKSEKCDFASNRLVCNGMEGLCIVLRRLAYPNQYVDMIPIFGRHPTELS